MTEGRAERDLRRLCRRYVRDEPPDWRAPEDPDVFLRLARQHFLTPLLWGLLRDTLPADDPLALAMRRDAHFVAARMAVLDHMAGELLDGLSAARIPVLALKGAALAPRYYRAESDRAMRDVDLLVHRRDVESALRVAAERGLRRFEDRQSLAFELRFGSAVVLTPTPDDDAGPSIDLHWDLFDPAQFPRRGAAWLEAAWGQSRPARVAGRSVRILRPEHAVLHLAAHLAVHHAFSGLVWYCDLGRLLRLEDLDWEVVLASAEALRLRSVLALVLAAVGDLFGVEPPAEVVRRLAGRSLRRAVARRLVLGRALRLLPMHHLEHVTPLLLMDRGRDCLVSTVRAVAPGPTWASLRYGGRWPVAYARHGGRALGILTRLFTARALE